MPKVVRGYKEAARKRILDAAGEVLRRKGVGGATMDEIARAIGVSKGALYLYFPTKTRLLEAVMARYREQMIARLEPIVAKGDLAEGMAGAIDEIFSGDFDPRVWHEVIADSANDPEIRAVLRRDNREDVRQIRMFLQRLEERGRIPPMSDPEVVADTVALLLGGGIVEASLRDEPAATKRKLVRALRLVLGLPRPPRFPRARV